MLSKCIPTVSQIARKDLQNIAMQLKLLYRRNQFYIPNKHFSITSEILKKKRKKKYFVSFKAAAAAAVVSLLT